ncbi:MAG: NAD(+) diphosphatase [Saccharofermentans sp.]|nr:NAD(+) diphosphatase [Saccharofermentans sp.]
MIQDIYPHKLKNTYMPEATPDSEALIVVFNKAGEILVKKDPEVDGSNRKIFPRLSEFTEGLTNLTYLYSMDEDKFFLAQDDVVIPDGYFYSKVRALRAEKDVAKKSIFEVFTAKQLASWYINNKFCGRCGHLTEHSTKERAIVCPECGYTIYPRVVPAVITAVIARGETPDKDRILLTKYNSGIGYYALVAGFTEIGETLEETVAREVMEETGIKVKNLRYYKSQPWGVVDDLLAGFFCEADGDLTIHRDESELSVAEWKYREEVVLQPDQLSLTNEMMTIFKEGREPRD